MKLTKLLLSGIIFVSISANQADDQLNILLFTADDLHAESHGVYGGKPADLTPNLDAFAAQSLLFNRAHLKALGVVGTSKVA